MSVERSRQLGQALMGASVLSLLMFLAGMTRRSYIAVAVPVAAGLGVIAALTFWVGYTMATTEWDESVEPAGADTAPTPESDAEPQATAADSAAESSVQ
jgi:predicted membrane-bound dolichyl-phosphate-mannose-protein mannosyltransferase